MDKFDWDDIAISNSETPHFNDVAEKVRSRRQFLKTGVGASALGFFGMGMPAFAKKALAADASQLGSYDFNQLKKFKGLPHDTVDDVTLPEGYRYQVIKPWGDKLHTNSPVFKGDASETAEEQLQQVGFNHDGHHYFPIDAKDSQSGSSTEGLLVTNHEYTTADYLYPKDIYPGEAGWNLDWVRKSQYAMGVSVTHIRQNADGKFETVLDSKYNRSINATTPGEIVGPAAGSELLKTNKDPEGKNVEGTFQNCGNGFTLWNTYLTCEENFTDVFGVGNVDADSVDYDDYMSEKQKRLLQRYKGADKASSYDYKWDFEDDRFNWTKEPNEVNRHGWITEIDPFDPESKPKKLTALGRFKHENAALTVAKDKRVVVYMGDDQRSEYIYKFISNNKYQPNNQEANRTLLHEGTLYVARFSDNMARKNKEFMGTGEWLPLTLDSATTDGKTLGDYFDDMGDLLVNTRTAADLVGATPMDRPEWIAVHPHTGEVYSTLTNNSDRGSGKERFPGGPVHPGAFGPNPRNKNQYGQVIRWFEDNNDHTATEFEWDIFVLAGNPNVYPQNDLRSGGKNIDDLNTFNSPDGVAVDPRGLVWILQDGTYSNKGDYEGQGNNSMFVGDPKTKTLRRFLVGPVGCEITGITWTPDMKHLFINIQHPGEGPDAPEAHANPTGTSTWPEGPGKAGRPRPATIIISREDGQQVGTF